MIAAYLLEVHDNDVEFDVDRFIVKGAPEKFKTMKEIAFAAYNQAIPGIEPGLEAVSYYDPPNMTYPFGAYVCVMDIDVDTGRDRNSTLLCTGRLWNSDQPDDYRRSSAWWPDGSTRCRTRSRNCLR